MKIKFMRKFFTLAIILTSFISIQATAKTSSIENSDSSLVQPKAMTIDASLDKDKADKIIRTARLFYTFWNTGDSKYIAESVSPDFIDNTLPEGRPQGPKGLLFASKNFRQAVPDLHCSVEDMLVTGDKVTARLILSGTFKGKFLNHAPTNKPVKFIAIDILHIKNGQLIEDWHLEDNLTLMQQLNAVKMQ